MNRFGTGLKLLSRATALAAALLLFGCGGGGGDVGASSIEGTIGGTGIKGPVSGATVSAYAISNGAKGVLIATGSSDSQGNFNLAIGSHSGPVMLQLSGGTYTDEASGTTMPMASGDVLSVVLPSVAAGATINGIQVTPMTSMAQSMAQHMAGGMTEANITAANIAVGHYFMVGDIVHTQPMNPLTPGSGNAATQDMMNYGMSLAAMSQYAKNAGLSISSSFVTAMMQDASDGVMDGRMGGGPIGMGGGMMGGGMMQSSAGTSGLANAMADFMNSVMNRSGVGATNMAGLMQQLRASDGHMH